MAEPDRPYAAALLAVGTEQPRTIVLDAGLASATQTDAFRAALPGRYFNLGIAEQNAVGLASGLARRGFVPMLHSFANFLVRRAHEQIALSVAWPGLNVKIVAASCGLFDGRNGASHMAIDDLAAMAALPGMTVIEPGDQRQLRRLLGQATAEPGPVYFRVRRYGMPAALLPEAAGGDGTVPVVHAEAPACTLVAAGSMLAVCLEAAQALAAAGLAVDLVHVAILVPLDAGPILASACRSGRVAVVENHVVSGGFGDAVGRVLGPRGIPLHRLGLPSEHLPAGDSDWLLRRCRLDPASLAERIAALISNPPS